MKTFSIMKFTVPVLSLLAVLGGCQGVQLTGKPASLDNAAFMQLWDTYRHCQASVEIDAMQEDVRQLTRAALAQAQPVLRLAADPKAMSAACALSTGRVALRTERFDLATGLFRAVLRNHPQPEYAFYVDQARIGLELVDRAVQLVRQDGVSTPAVIQVSSETLAPRTGPTASFED
jgi:hypothetical protein